MRELSLKQINGVVRKVTEGVNVGVGDGKIDVDSHCDKGPASRPMRSMASASSVRTARIATGLVATLTSRMAASCGLRFTISLKRSHLTAR